MTDQRLKNLRKKFKEESKPGYMQLPASLKETPAYVSPHESGVKKVNRAIERYNKGHDSIIEFKDGVWTLHGRKEFITRIQRDCIRPADGVTIPLIDWSDEEEDMF